MLPECDEEKPAVVVVAHLRKRGNGDGRKRGRDLLPELSGSGMIGSAARSVFILEPASADQEDNRVVWTNAKNNDGLEGQSSAWYRCNGLFAHCEEFDFEEFFDGGDGGREKITPSIMENALTGQPTKKVAAKRIMDATGCGSSAAYAAFKRFSSMIEEISEGTLRWKG